MFIQPKCRRRAPGRDEMEECRTKWLSCRWLGKAGQGSYAAFCMRQDATAAGSVPDKHPGDSKLARLDGATFLSCARNGGSARQPLDSRAEMVFTIVRQNMNGTFKISLRDQRVLGQTSRWHRCVCRSGIVGGNF